MNHRRFFQLCGLAVAAATLVSSQPSAAQSNARLDSLLNKMDAAAAQFRSASAAFTWEQYQKVVEETDTQKGKIYFRKTDGQSQMAADITEPDPKYVTYTDNKLQLYQPRIDQITVYNAGQNHEEVESFLVLGFGGGGHDLLKSFDVKYLGAETVLGVATEKIDLTPKSQKLRNNIEHIILWIDPARSVSVQQQFFQPGGDYRLTKYSDIELNKKIPDSAFKFKTTSNTKTVSPQG